MQDMDVKMGVVYSGKEYRIHVHVFSKLSSFHVPKFTMFGLRFVCVGLGVLIHTYLCVCVRVCVCVYERCVPVHPEASGWAVAINYLKCVF